MAPARIALVVFSAGLQAVALPPWGVVSVGWVALTPLLFALRGCTIPRAAAYGLLWGIAAIWGTGYWVPQAFAFYYGQTLGFGVGFAFAVSVVFGAFYAGFAVSVVLVRADERRLSGMLLIGALWVTWEFARAHLLTGEPWLLLGYALVGAPRLAQAADLGGVFLLSFAIAVANAGLVGAVLAFRADSGDRPDARHRPVGALVFVFVPTLLWAYGAWRMAQPLPQEPRVGIRIVQGNNDPGTQWQEELYGGELWEYLRLSASAWEAGPAGPLRLLVWPESAVTSFLARESGQRAAISRRLQPWDADLIVGAPHVETDGTTERFFNSVFYLSTDGEVQDRYDKQHLLPFAEYFPLRAIDLLRRRFERVRFFTPGGPATTLRTRIGPVAAVVCFEGIFPGLVRERMQRDAVLLVNVSNDAWLGRGAGPEQHLSMIVLRAIENRTWVVRATTTGISAIVDPFGRVVQRSPSFAPANVDGGIVPMHVATPYKRFGDLFAHLSIAASVAVVARAAVRRRRPTGI